MNLTYEQQSLINHALIYAEVLAKERAASYESSRLDGHAGISESYQNEALAFAALREELRKEWDRL